MRRSRRNRRGKNQYKVRQHGTWKRYLAVYFIGLILVIAFAQHFKNEGASAVYADSYILSPVPDNFNIEYEAVEVETEETPSDEELIVAYIARLWGKHGTAEVVHAINCFYSESGLRVNAVGQNSDAPRSKDWNVAQLNDYWHNLTEEQKTDIYAGLDKAYEIYVSRGNWSAWYGKACN